MLFGEVKENFNLNISNKPDSFINNAHYTDLKKIFNLLQKNRGYNDFIRANKLPNVDFFVVKHRFIVEFDESQHFTAPRKLTLSNYPCDLKLGYYQEKWINLCIKLNKKDNDPPFRDEQRAWYDTLRDFAPTTLNLKPTIRIYARDYKWCDLNVDNDVHKILFKKYLFSNNDGALT